MLDRSKIIQICESNIACVWIKQSRVFQLVFDKSVILLQGAWSALEHYVILVTRRFAFLRYDRYRIRGKSYHTIWGFDILMVS